jgi:hypothetical protein
MLKNFEPPVAVRNLADDRHGATCQPTDLLLAQEAVAAAIQRSRQTFSGRSTASANE